MDIFQNIFLCCTQNKESPTGLQNINFGVNCPFKINLQDPASFHRSICFQVLPSPNQADHVIFLNARALNNENHT